MTDFLRSPVSLMILLSMAGCASSNQSIPDDELGTFMSTQQLDMRVDNRIDNESAPPESGPLAGQSAGFTLETPLGDQRRGDSRTLPQDGRPTSDYRIGPHDLLEISVFGVPELDTTARVSASGFITMPLIGLVDAEGLTSEELEERVATRLRQDYLQDPNVTIFIAEYASQRVTMEGEVGRPGIYSMTGRTSLLQALALAGGFGRLADRRHIRLIRGSGVATERFRPPAEPVLSGPQTRVVLASRLLWDKGIGEYIDAARLLRAAGLPIRFLLVGEPDPGNPASIPPATLDEWAAEGVVELLGRVDDMPALYAGVDIAVLPSYREGLPKSLIEAAACGLPLITTDVPGCREVVTDGVDGLLIPARDSAALAGAIRRLHDDPARARRLGRAARARALAEFDERIVIERTLAVYRELLLDAATIGEQEHLARRR